MISQYNTEKNTKKVWGGKKGEGQPFRHGRTKMEKECTQKKDTLPYLKEKGVTGRWGDLPSE